MKKFLSLVLALVMTMSLVTISAGAKDFTDDDKITYEEAVAVVSEIGVVDGYADGKFNPTNTLTRQAAAKIICNLILGPTTAAELHADTAPYKDVPATSEFAGYIAYCAKEGIISGYADGTFKPGNTLTGYAFMKMLLGALGYDASIEGYTGANWSINVAKQAIAIGLNKSLEGDFNGIKAVTREEACLYAFNTLQADLVEYDTTISTTINGQTVTIGNSLAKAQKWNNSATRINNIKADEYIQFAEQYFPKLEKKNDTDDFMRPAYTWTYNKSEIGTYVDWDLLVEFYTKSVTGKDIYELLGSAAIRDNKVTAYVDGAETDDINAKQLVRSNEDDLDHTGKGVLTEVYLDTDDGEITIVCINTWLAKANADYNKSRETLSLTVYTTDSGVTKTVDVEDVPAIADVEEDDYLLVNMTMKDRSKLEVVAIQDAEVLSDSTVTKFSQSGTDTTNGFFKSVTVNGTKYDAAKMAKYDADALNLYDASLLTDMTYNVYLDQYGYAIGVDLYEGTKNYVFITGYDRSSSNISIKTADAAAIFLDGTMDVITVNVTDTNKNIKALSPADANFDEWASGGDSTLNRWYTYSTNEKGVYTLKPATKMLGVTYESKTIDCSNVKLSNSTGTKNAFGNDDSIFLTVEVGDVDTTGTKSAITDVTGVYTGVQEVKINVIAADKYNMDGSNVYALYDNDNYLIAAVVVGEAEGSIANYVFTLSDVKSEEKIDDTYYWEFDAIVAGEIQTLTVKSKYPSTVNALKECTVQKVSMDGEYVTKITTPAIDVSAVSEAIVDGDEIYDVKNIDGVMFLEGRTLYTNATTDLGLTFTRDAKAVVIQDENNKTHVEREYDSVSEAVASLADPNPNTDTLEFKGRVTAILNEQGVAEWVVIHSDTKLTTGNYTPDTSKSGGIQLDSLTYNDTDKQYEIGFTILKAYTGQTKYNVTITTAAGSLVTKDSVVYTGAVSVGAKDTFVAAGAEKRADDYIVTVEVVDANGNVLASATEQLAI